MKTVLSIGIGHYGIGCRRYSKQSIGIDHHGVVDPISNINPLLSNPPPPPPPPSHSYHPHHSHSYHLQLPPGTVSSVIPFY